MAARLFTSPENGRFARTMVNRIWDRLFGRGLVASVDDMDREAWDPALLDWLAADFADHGYDLQFLLRRIMTSRAYQSAADWRAPAKDYVFRGPLPRRLTAEQFLDSISAVTGEWPVLVPRQAGAGTFAREWRFKSNPLTRALGRPIRDQVFTTRNTEPTTLQALEVVNGETLRALLERGAARMLGRLREPPPNLWDSGVLSGKATARVDIDISGVKQLRLMLQDADSYDPARTVAGWKQAELVGPQGTRPLPDGPQALNSTVVHDIAGQGFTRFRAAAGIDENCLQSDISPRVRFFIFGEEPDPHQLVRVSGEPPVAFEPEKFTTESLTARIYRHALGRPPNPAEQAVAAEFLTGGTSTEGLADLLWAVFVSPEFQYIQ